MKAQLQAAHLRFRMRSVSPTCAGVEPGEGGVIVSVRAIGINYPDLLITQGL